MDTPITEAGIAGLAVGAAMVNMNVFSTSVSPPPSRPSPSPSVLSLPLLDMLT